MFARRLTVACCALVSGLAASSVAGTAGAAPPRTCFAPHNGPCNFADTFDLSWSPQGDRFVGVLNFGLVWPGITPGSYELLCEEAYGRSTPERVLIDHQGWVYVQGAQGVRRSRLGDGCAFAEVVGFPDGAFVHQVIAHPVSPTILWAMATVAQQRAVYRSTDGGARFVPLHTFEKNVILWHLMVAPSDPEVLYASGPGRAGLFALARSNNGGASFTLTDPLPALSEPLRNTALRAIAPDDSARLIFARDTTTGAEEIWQTRDSGTTVTRLLSLSNDEIVSGFSFGASPATLYVAGYRLVETENVPPAHLYIWRDGTGWEPPIASGTQGPRFRCLRYQNNRLYACAAGAELKDTFLFGSSADEGKTWDTLLTTRTLPAPKACVAARCPSTAQWLCEKFAICDNADGGVAGDGGTNSDGGLATDAGTGPGSPGCGCRMGGRATPSTPLWLAVPGVALWARLRKRRRTRPAGLLLLIAIGLAASSCDDAAVDKGDPITISFTARAGTTPITCQSPLPPMGTPSTAMVMQDLRFFVSNLRLVDGQGKEHAVALTQDGKWQRGDTALLDFENATGTCLEATTPDVNHTVRGTVSGGPFVALRFSLGIPFQQNHASPATAQPPFTLGALQWSWQAGYKFLRLDLAQTAAPGEAWYVHVGSTRCASRSASDPPATSCLNPNRADIELAPFDPARHTVIADLALLLAGADLTSNTPGTVRGCFSDLDDPECAKVFPGLGLDLATGACVNQCRGQTFFRVE